MEYALILILFHTLTGQVSTVNEGLKCSFEENFCDWSNDGWQRKTESGFETTGPSSAADGTYYIQINTNKPDHLFTIKTAYQKTSGTSCLKFKYHLHGQHVKYLTYGYYTDTNTFVGVYNITDRENFWNCATFDLSNLPQTAKGIYFQGMSGISVYSIIGLDRFTYNTGNDCSSSDCPVPQTKATTTVTSTTTETASNYPTTEDDIWIMIGGICGGVVILLTIITTVCIIKMRKSKKNQFLPRATSFKTTRALPPIPQDKSESAVISVTESLDEKFSTNQSHPATDNFINSSVERTFQDHSTLDETTPYDDGYVHVPPDYDIDDDKDKSSNKDEQDDDYLEPTIGLPSQNQYESDPTESGKIRRETLQNNQKSSANHMEIPAIPVPKQTNLSHVSTNDSEVDADYDDAIAATGNDGSSKSSEESDRDSNDNDDYLIMTDNVSDDYVTPTSS